MKVPRGPAAVREECRQSPLEDVSGKVDGVMRLKSEDLPVSRTKTLRAIEGVFSNLDDDVPTKKNLSLSA